MKLLYHLRIAIIGFIMGAADLVPGVSGGTIAFFPLSAFAEKLNAFEAFEDVAFDYESFRTLEAFVLRHDGKSK